MAHANVTKGKGPCRETATMGMAWATISAVLIKLMGFVSQFVLGWILSQGDFGLYAIAISISSFVVPLQNGGIHKILIQRCTEYDRLAPDLYRLALLFNLFFMAALLAMAPLAGTLYDAPELTVLLAITAVSIPLRTPGAIIRSKLLSDFRFRENARVNTISSLLRNAFTISFAVAGLGPVSFVIPLVLIALYENYAFWKLAGYLPRGGTISWPLFRMIFRDSRWIMLGALVLALSLQSDYLVIGLFEDKATIGTYFFAFQLSISFSVLFTAGIDSVMLPSFTHLTSDPVRQNAAFSKAFGVLSFLVALVAIGMVLLTEPLVHLLWAGKWDIAIVLTQLLLVSLLTRLPMSLTQSFLESKGYWKWRFYIQTSDTLALMGAAAVGAWFGDVLAIAVAISFYRLISAAVFSAIGCGLAGISPRLVFSTNMLMTVSSLMVGSAAWGMARLLVPLEYGVAQALFSAAIFWLLFFLFARRFKPDVFGEVQHLFYKAKARFWKPARKSFGLT